MNAWTIFYIIYLSISVGFYLGATVVNKETFKEVKYVYWILGVIGALVWPILFTRVVILNKEL